MTKQLKVKCECKEPKVRSADPNLCAYEKGNKKVYDSISGPISEHFLNKVVYSKCTYCGEE